MLTEYTINKVDRLPDFDPDDPIWQKAEPGEYAYWHEKSSEHHPKTVLRALHNGDDIMLCWQVNDRYVRIAHTATNSMVCEDACVEAFLQPLKIEKGYINIEVNAGGCIHSSHIRNWTRAPGGFADFEYIAKDIIRKLTAKGNLPQVIDPEDTEPCNWWMIVRIPRAYLESIFQVRRLLQPSPLGHPPAPEPRAQLPRAEILLPHPLRRLIPAQLPKEAPVPRGFFVPLRGGSLEGWKLGGLEEPRRLEPGPPPLAAM